MLTLSGTIGLSLLDLLHDVLLVSLLGNHGISFLESTDKSVNSAVELVQVSLHVFLLTLEVFCFLVTVEVLKVVLISVKLVTLSILVLLRVGVLLLHESLSSLKGSSLDILSGLREQVAEFEELGLLDTHEDDVRENLGLTVFLVIWVVGQGLEDNIGFEAVKDLVVTEVGVLWQVEDWLFFFFLVVLIVENLNKSLSDEIHFLDIALETDNSLSWGIDSAVHADDQLVGETSLALLEEVVE